MRRLNRRKSPLVMLAVVTALLVATPLSATWSIIAVDTRTGLVVIASATCVTAGGLRTRGGLMRIQAVVVPGIGVAAAQAGVDFVIAETFGFYGEAQVALEAIKQAQLPAVVTFALHQEGVLRDGVVIEEACQRLEQAGAEVVGLNCTRGPQTMLPYVRRIRQAVACHVAAVPVPFRTSVAQPTFQSLQDPGCDVIPVARPFPTALDPFTCNRYEMAAFAQQAYAHNIRYLGGCCGSGPHHIRAMAEALGRHPAASHYSPDMSQHYAFGNHPRLTSLNREYAAMLQRPTA